MGQEVTCPGCDAEFVLESLEPLAECEHCWSEFQVHADLMGKKLKCPKCQRVTKIRPKSPRVVVACKQCNGNFSVPQNRIGWMVRCPLCSEETKVIESFEAEFLVGNDEDEILEVENVEDLVKGMPSFGKPKVEEPKPPIANIGHQGTAPQSPATPPAASGSKAYDPVILGGPVGKTTPSSKSNQFKTQPGDSKPVAPPRQTPKDSRVYDPVVLDQPVNNAASKSKRFSGQTAPKRQPAPKPASSRNLPQTEEQGDFVKKEESLVGNFLVTGTAAILAIGFVFVVFYLFWIYVINSRAPQNTIPSQHPNSVLTEEERLAE